MGDRSDSGSTSVLVVDDDIQLRRALVRSLRVHGYEPLAASGYDEALRCLEERSVDVVLTDLRMGDKDGIELIGSIGCAAPDTRSILMSAYATAIDGQRALDSGAVRILRKPFDTAEMIGAVDRALRAPRTSCPPALSKQAPSGVLPLDPTRAASSRVEPPEAAPADPVFEGVFSVSEEGPGLAVAAIEDAERAAQRLMSVMPLARAAGLWSLDQPGALYCLTRDGAPIDSEQLLSQGALGWMCEIAPGPLAAGEARGDGSVVPQPGEAQLTRASGTQLAKLLPGRRVLVALVQGRGQEVLGDCWQQLRGVARNLQADD